MKEYAEIRGKRRYSLLFDGPCARIKTYHSEGGILECWCCVWDAWGFSVTFFMITTVSGKSRGGWGRCSRPDARCLRRRRGFCSGRTGKRYFGRLLTAYGWREASFFYVCLSIRSFSLISTSCIIENILLS